MTSNFKKVTTLAAIPTYPSKSQLMLHHTGIHLSTTLSTNLTRLTEKYSNVTAREAALGSADFSALMSTSDLDKYTDFIVSAISTAVDKAIPKSKSVRSESNPISDETIALIKEKRRPRMQYSQNKDLAVKTRINQLQKQVNPKGTGGGCPPHGRFLADNF